jgi:uracil-DNA glycosylase
MEKKSFFPFELPPSWLEVLKEELLEPYITALAAFVARERRGQIPVYPPQELVFNAFWQTPFDKVKVLIMGQDPYHGPSQAHGLSFSVPVGVQPPPSLQNIFKELTADVGFSPPHHGCLIKWAKQGVMLLNATLTVRQSEPMSHHKKGWELFTDAVIEKLGSREDPVIFMLWGKSAQEKCKKIKGLGSSSRPILLTAPHPSPLSAHQGFFGCRHFSKCNSLLMKQGKAPIDWNL